ncbi:MAG: hypothetical protein KA210_00910 [Bacteroidia bacterium]|nr:hypothetical protein [Bacteroidia bacterium]
MKIFVQARKDGYNTLYPKPTPDEFRQFASDIIRIQNEPENIYGKCVYSIAFSNGGCIYTKHIIVHDVQRGGLGNVGFSIHIPKNNNLSGDNIKNLLDDLINTYSQNFCPDYYLRNVQEDWVLFSSLANSYDSKIVTVSSEENEDMQPGNLDAAFIYFNSDIELQKYFEQPLQEEYIPYRQIYFISSEFKVKPNPENPLYVLKNSGKDLTGVIDLENPSFRLREYHGNAKNGISITIKNSKGRQLYNKDKIYRKEEITIVYSKKNYKEKSITGSLLNSEEIRNYLDISNDSKIDVLKEVDLEPEVKTISIEVEKRDGSRVMGTVITCKNNYQPEKQVLNNQVTFSGEELNERWIISAKHGEYYFSDNILIDFDKDTINPIRLTLNEKRVLKIVAQDYEQPRNGITEFKVIIQGKGNYNENDIEFINDEINKSFEITVESQGYLRSEIQSYYPSEGNKTIYFQLKKNHKTIGELKNNEKKIDLVSQKTENDKSWYQKPKLIFISIASIFILSIGIWGLIHLISKPKQDQKLISSVQINNYLESDNLILDTLKFYQVNWEKQNPQNKTKDKGFLSSLLSNNEDSNVSNETDNWTQVSDSINSAIYKRELINNKDFEELEKIHFNKQESFEKIIHDIRKNKYEFLKEKLGDISSLSLAEIESKIKEILNEQDSEKGSDNSPVNEGPKTSPKETEPKQSPGSVTTISGDKKENKGPEKTEVNSTGTGTSDKKTKIDKNKNSANPSSDISSEIKKYIKGDEITFNKLEEFKSKTVDSKIKESITIALKLWELDGTDAKAKREYLKQIEDNRFLSGSKLNLFVKNNKTKDLKTWNRTKSLKEISNENN